jgi:hypothetical protein
MSGLVCWRADLEGWILGIMQTVDFHTYTTIRDWARRATAETTSIDQFYKEAMADGVRMRSGQFLGQCVNERDWEKLRRPYYNLYPAIVPMLTRLNLDLDSDLIRLPLPALCVRFPKDLAKNPLQFDWKGKSVPIRCILMGDMNEGKGISVLIDIGEVMPGGVPIYTYRNFPRKPGLTVEQSLASLGTKGLFADIGIVIPDELVTDCIRLCCSLCLLENDPSVISPDVLTDDRAKFEQTGDEKCVSKAHRRGKVGWNVGQQIEVAPHYRRPHLTLVWTGHGRSVPKIVPRRGAIVHREIVAKVPSGFGE